MFPLFCLKSKTIPATETLTVALPKVHKGLALFILGPRADPAIIVVTDELPIPSLISSAAGCELFLLAKELEALFHLRYLAQELYPCKATLELTNAIVLDDTEVNTIFRRIGLEDNAAWQPSC